MESLWNSVLVFLCLISALHGNPDHPEVTTTSGNIFGTSFPEAYAFYSIPYGKAPIGELRFEPPHPFRSSNNFNASIPSYTRCFEYAFINCTGLGDCGKNYSEDCLVLNINVPATVDLSSPPSQRLPVMFWIHGGAFFAGAGTDNLYDGRWLSNSTNTIVVSINYRLDSLGFLYYEENGKLLGGNQGFKDQQLALQWVQDNIEHFGGDKNKVTLFGNSAGAQSITYHLISKTSDPLFARAIIQSSPVGFPFLTKSKAQELAERLINSLNCSGSGYECLKQAFALTLMENHVQVVSSEGNYFNLLEPYRPVLDGDEFKEQHLEAFQAGNWLTNKEVIVGFTTKESIVSFDSMNRTEFELFVNFAVGPQHASAVINEYAKLAGNNPAIDYNYRNIMEQALTDMEFVCPGRAMSRFMSSTTSPTSTNVYFYVISYPLDTPNCKDFLPYCGTPFHSSEVYYIFNSGPSTGLIFSKSDEAVSNIYNKFWGHFAHFGNPSTNASVWPRYTSDSSTSLSSTKTNSWSNILIPGPKTSVQSEYREDFCDFWDSLNYYVNITSPGGSSGMASPSAITLSAIALAVLEVYDQMQKF